MQFASVRFAQYLVKRSTADESKDALTIRRQSTSIIHRGYVDERRRFERCIRQMTKKSREHEYFHTFDSDGDDFYRLHTFLL